MASDFPEIGDVNPYRAPTAALEPQPDQSLGGFVGYGGFWRRFVALFLDVIIMGVLGALIGGVVGAIYGAAGMGVAAEPAVPGQLPTTDFVLFGVVQVISIVINICYYAGMESSSKQATLGKMALGMKVVDLHGRRISFGRAVGRYFAKILSFITLYIGFIMAAFDERKRALHDRIAGTLVVRVG